MSVTTKLHETKWLHLYERTWDHNGKTLAWNFVSRDPNVPKTCENKKPDAVLIAAVIQEDGKEPRHILTKEYRVPLGGFELGFPAGLIGKNESAAQAAEREFKEETGLSLCVGGSSPNNLFSTPGMTEESCQIVFGTAYGTPSPQFLEPGENIETFLLTKTEVAAIIYQDKPLGCMGWGCKAWPIMAAWAECFAGLYE